MEKSFPICLWVSIKEGLDLWGFSLSAHFKPFPILSPALSIFFLPLLTTALLKSNSQTLQFTCLKVYSSMTFSILQRWATITTINFRQLHHPPKETPYSLAVSCSSFPPAFPALGITYPLSVSMICLFWIFHIGRLIQYVVSYHWLPSHNIFKVHTCCSTCTVSLS